MELPSGGIPGGTKNSKFLHFDDDKKFFVGVSAFDPLPSNIQNIVEESWIGIKAMALEVDKKFRT